MARHVEELEAPLVPWFPTKISDFDFIGKKCLTLGDGIEHVDHPSFTDPVYRKRREDIGDVAFTYKMVDESIPGIDYNRNEIKTWAYLYPKIREAIAKCACDETNYTLDDMEKKVAGFGPETIPQLDDISKYLVSKTGWRLKPVGGLLSQREFLNALAFKIFHSTQYIRHHEDVEYTPEPDILHELIGHAPMFAHQDFADFSQQIGLASLGASDAELLRLAAVYWHTIEFGMCLNSNGERKAYGAGIMGSVAELEYCQTDKPEFLPLDLDLISREYLSFLITDMQPTYFVAESFERAKE